jgi:hypothetical protein
MITELETQLINKYVARNLESYKKFMGIDEMPDFNIVLIEIALEEAKQKGYGVPAAHSYDVSSDKHILKVWKDIYKSILNTDYIIFHEFTHMYDTVTYSAKDKILYASNRGFTEYHAAQIEMLKLLGAESKEDKIPFSLTQTIEIISGRETVIEYISNSHVAVTELFSRPNFPDSIQSLSTGLGMIFNHLGRISICQMYANDYDQYMDEIENKTVEESYIGDKFSIRSLMKGFLGEKDILNIGKIYLSIIFELTEKMKRNL